MNGTVHEPLLFGASHEEHVASSLASHTSSEGTKLSHKDTKAQRITYGFPISFIGLRVAVLHG